MLYIRIIILKLCLLYVEHTMCTTCALKQAWQTFLKSRVQRKIKDIGRQSQIAEVGLATPASKCTAKRVVIICKMNLSYICSPSLLDANKWTLPLTIITIFFFWLLEFFTPISLVYEIILNIN